MNEYIKINSKEDIPVGSNLVFVCEKDGVKNYYIGECTLTSTGHKLITASGLIHFSMGKFLAYKNIEEYKGA